VGAQSLARRFRPAGKGLPALPCPDSPPKSEGLLRGRKYTGQNEGQKPYTGVLMETPGLHPKPRNPEQQATLVRLGKVLSTVCESAV
jgi:hypothetical protein